jgi:hypothetical protein
MPTKIEVNVQTGEVVELELEGEELAAYEASLVEQANAPAPAPAEPTLAEIVAQLQSEIAALKEK